MNGLEEHPRRALRFTGFGLNIWPWPLLNILIEIRGTAVLRPFHGQSTSRSPKTTYANLETYEIFEDKLGVIKVKVHRKAERG